MNTKQISAAYQLARERYAALGVNTDTVLKQLAKVPVSLHCWQGDDVGGFENFGGALTGRMFRISASGEMGVATRGSHGVTVPGSAIVGAFAVSVPGIGMGFCGADGTAAGPGRGVGNACGAGDRFTPGAGNASIGVGW